MYRKGKNNHGLQHDSTISKHGMLIYQESLHKLYWDKEMERLCAHTVAGNERGQIIQPCGN